MIPVERLAPYFNVKERCVFCRERTDFWTKLNRPDLNGYATEVACCQDCARNAQPEEVPTKMQWLARERIADHLPNKIDRAAEEPGLIQAWDQAGRPTLTKQMVGRAAVAYMTVIALTLSLMVGAFSLIVHDLLWFAWIPLLAAYILINSPWWLLPSVHRWLGFDLSA